MGKSLLSGVLGIFSQALRCLTGLNSWNICDTCQNDRGVYRDRKGINGSFFCAEYNIYYLAHVWSWNSKIISMKYNKFFHLLTWKMTWNVVTVSWILLCISIKLSEVCTESYAQDCPYRSTAQNLKQRVGKTKSLFKSKVTIFYFLHKLKATVL